MTHLDGRAQRAPLRLEADVVIVGSGPAGSAAARVLARGGARVVVVEAGPWRLPHEHPLSSFAAMADTYVDMGASVVLGRAPIPVIQGRMVGGSSPINGAICWRLPRPVYDEWTEADPALEAAMPWETLEALTDELEEDLHVTPTDPAVAGPKNQLMARGAETLGLAHRPIRRNVRGCEGLGRCLQGCPRGRKQSVDQTLLGRAQEQGAVVLSSAPVARVLVERGRATGVMGTLASGAPFTVRAREVVLAASAIQTPALLLASGIRQGPVGRHLQCHPGVSMAGRFDEPVRMWEGATQGHEVTGLTHERLKFEVLGMGQGALVGRLDGVGSELARSVADRAHWVDWGAAIRAHAEGRVHAVMGRPVVRWSPSREDVRLFRRGLRLLGELMLAAGATELSPGVRGFPGRVRTREELVALEERGPSSPAAFTAVITHLFGTCRMGSDPRDAVVRPDFRHHATPGLWVADSSVFPTHIGVNPQIPIMALASLCGRRILEAA